MSCEDKHRSGCLIEVATEEIIEIDRLADRRLKIREIPAWYEEDLGATGAAFAHIGSKTCSNGCFIREFRKFPVKSELIFEPIHNCWVQHYTPATKVQPKQWPQRGEPTATRKKAKPVTYTGNVMVYDNYFLGCAGDNFYQLEKGKVITGEYYANLLQHLSDEIYKRPHLAKKIVLFYHDNDNISSCNGQNK